MNITRLAATYRRSVSVTLPDGREAWIAHEATVEASYDANEIAEGSLPEENANLRQMAMKEVSEAIKAEYALIEKVTKARAEQEAEPFVSQDSSLAKLPKV